MKNNLIIKNLIASLFLQCATILSGLIVPKIILSYFGSETNGLVSSINQFLNYIMILEGGVGSVIMSALYKPLNDKDDEKISGIINAARKFFKTIAIIYIAYVVGVAFIYPIFVRGQFSYIYVVGLIFVLAINLFVQYYFSISYRLLLNADRKVYIVSFVQGVIVIANIIAVIICTSIFRDVLLLKFVSAAVFCVIPLIYNVYVKRYYTLDKEIKPDNQLISQRWDGFGINLAYFIHANTDIVILTFFSTLENVSVYAVYYMVVNALKSLTISLSSAIIPSFGKVIVEGDKEKANEAFDIYQFGMMFITTILFSCGIVLVSPFVGVYTLGITDTNYNQPIFGAILMLAEMIYCLRDPMVSVAYTSGNFTAISKYCYLEAGINIIISLLFVRKFGLVGIAAGTAIAMLYRMIMHVIFAKRRVLYRPIRKFVKEISVFGSTTFVICLLSWLFLIRNDVSYFQWIMDALKVFATASVLTTLVSFIFYRETLMSLMQRFRR